MIALVHILHTLYRKICKQNKLYQNPLNHFVCAMKISSYKVL